MTELSNEETNQAFLDAMEEVHTRFVLNLPSEELESSNRLFFQIEQAWWFYEDIICDEMQEGDTIESSAGPASYAAALSKKSLPRFKKLLPFARKFIELSPMLSPLMDQFDALWKEFSIYRRAISTYGTILLNKDCTKVLLCQDYAGKSWTFPAGKVNQGEGGIDAGARETYEETGFDPNCNLGTTKTMKEVCPDLPWNALRHEDKLHYTEQDGSGKLRTCFICHGVPEDFPFAPVARKEVIAVEWHDISDLPKKTFAVIPFMKGLKAWIRKNVKSSRSKTPAKSIDRSNSKLKKRAGSKVKERNSSRGSRHSSPKKILTKSNDNLIQAGLAKVGDDTRWSEEEMFKVNEKLIGKKIEYDGNPQVFASKGFNGVDPHSFRVVGGGFMNSGTSEIANNPDQSRLQPLYRKEDNGSDRDVDDDELKPFFSEDGITPLDDVISNEKKTSKKKSKRSNSSSSRSSNNASPMAVTQDTKHENNQIHSNMPGLAILNMLRGSKKDKQVSTIPVAEEDGGVDVFMTDKEITAKSQKEKTKATECQTLGTKPLKSLEENEDFLFLKEWVTNLPKSKPTKLFGDFHFDTDAILMAMKQ